MSDVSAVTMLYGPIVDRYKKLEQADRQRYEEFLHAMGTQVIAEQVVADRGLTGEAARFFVMGFIGVNAAIANPRAKGMEPVFRDGRRAKAEKGIEQRIRASAVALRSDGQYSFEGWLKFAYQTNPVPWMQAFPG